MENNKNIDSDREYIKEIKRLALRIDELEKEIRYIRERIDADYDYGQEQEECE